MAEEGEKKVIFECIPDRFSFGRLRALVKESLGKVPVMNGRIARNGNQSTGWLVLPEADAVELVSCMNKKEVDGNTLRVFLEGEDPPREDPPREAAARSRSRSRSRGR
mmetsp:Transcript_2160/g.4345  ORF Transcript_2160/g.4345 Transcript_2160/m.4345 type:complete len:108 (-) Transcript_2160:119-442(-)